jgi:hypothetical protein
MNKYSICILAMILLPVCTASGNAATALQASAEKQAPVFSVARMLLAGSIEEREPVGAVSAYSASTEKVYCFLEATDIMEDTEVSFVWYHENKRMAIVILPLKKGPKWRTYSSKKLGGLTGDWEVELIDANGNVILGVGFTVE